MSDNKFTQSFSRFEPKYQLDREAKRLVVVGKTDKVAIIESHADCALDKILNKFLDLGIDPASQFVNVVVDKDINPIDDDIDSKDKLFVKAIGTNKISELRTKYNIPDYVPDDEFIKALNSKCAQLSKELKEKIKPQNSSQIVSKDNVNKEVQNETQTIQVKKESK